MAQKRLRLSRPLRLLTLSLLAAVPLGCGGMGARPEATLGEVPSKGPVGKTIRANKEKFVACAQDSVTVQTGAVQTITLRFTVSPTGTVTKAQVEDMSAPDPDLYTCVTRALRKLHFPAPKDGKPKDIKYPLVLKSE